jgi:hypothetical protein
MPTVINIVLPAFAAILIGYLFGRFRRINLSSIVDVTINIGVPALVFVSLIKHDIVLVDAVKICAASLIIMLGCLVIAWIVFKLLKQRHSGLYLPISAMNSVNLPFPIVSLAYGASGMVAVPLFYFPNILFIFSFGTYLMAKKSWQHNVREVIKQPALYSSLLGITVNLFDIGIPGLLVDAVDFIALMAIPLMLFTLGYNLSKSRVTTLSTTLLSSFMRMGVGLGMGFLVVQVLGITGVFRAVVLLESVMPAAVLSSILATKYDNETELVSSVVFVTTLASLIVIPLMLQLLDLRGF